MNGRNGQRPEDGSGRNMMMMREIKEGGTGNLYFFVGNIIETQEKKRPGREPSGKS